jgi:uncharacterized protein (UPF0147 family)
MDELISIEKPNQFKACVVNSDENWRILNATGITFLTDQYNNDMDVIVYTRKDLQEIKGILESLSFNPYPTKEIK